MAKLSEHSSSKFVKAFYIGDSGAGKTGSLVSLVEAGYKLRVLDLDNGLGPLRQWVNHLCPDKIDNVDYETRRDQFKAGRTGPIAKGLPKAFTDSMKLMNEWSDGSKPEDWGPQTIFVLDSLTMLGQAAFLWAQSQAPSVKDPRQWFYSAQRACEHFISMLTGEEFKCHVLLLTHINMIEADSGTVKGYPSVIGTSLSKTICRFTDNLIAIERVGTGDSVRRKIMTMPTAVLDLKTTAPFKIKKEYDIRHGMAEIFETLLKETE